MKWKPPALILPAAATTATAFIIMQAQFPNVTAILTITAAKFNINYMFALNIFNNILIQM
jgi:hypothetical protein